jgi:hypothetical protein
MVARRLTIAAALLLLLLPAGAAAHHRRTSPRATMTAAGTCPGAKIRPDRIITGSFGKREQGSYVMVPFRVPRGTTAVRVKYCFDQPQSPTAGTPVVSVKHTLDLGLYEPRRAGTRLWGTREFRGWGGSSHPDVTVSAEGFSTLGQYTASPRVEPPGKTTRAFRPGPIREGLWAAELGVAAVVGASEGDLDGTVAWRLEIDTSSDPAFADEPYRPARYRTRPARRSAGWYAGDLHVHGEHSAYGDAPMRELLDYAFRPISAGGAGLDFLTLSDYVSGSSWGEVGRHQPRYPGRLIARSAEVITYRGHLNNHVTGRVIDYRTGAVLERRPGGALVRLRPARPASELLAAIKAAGGFTQINHPTIFPASVPAFANFCRGCSWEYSNGETSYGSVDGIEVATGPSGFGTPPSGANPFTVTAIDFYERALATGTRIAAVGVSDSHNAGRTPNPVTQAPIGEATTVVYAEELSEPGIECGVEARHTYVKVTGNAGPDLRFSATPRAGGPRAILGDVLRSAGARFEVRVLRGPDRELRVYKDGSLLDTVQVAGGDFVHRFEDAGPGRYRLQLQRGSTIETVSSPIWLEPGPGAVVRRDCRPLRVRGVVRRRSRVRRGALRARCRASGGGLRSCTVLVRAKLGRRGRKRTWTVGRGRVAMRGGSRRVRVRLNRRGRRLVRRHRRGRRVRLVFIVSDGDGATARDQRRTRLLRRRRR